MRRRLPGLSVGLAAMSRSLPTASCEVYQSSSAGADEATQAHNRQVLEHKIHTAPDNNCNLEDCVPDCTHELETLGREEIDGVVPSVSGGRGGGGAAGWQDHLGACDLSVGSVPGLGITAREGFVIEDVLRRERLTHPFSQGYFWRTATGQEVDLVLDRGAERIGIEVKANSAGNPHDARKLEAMLDDIGAAAGWLVGMGGESIQLTPRVRSVSLDRVPDWLP